MQNVMLKGREISWRKPRLFALWAALGALAGAALGEGWLALTAPAALPPAPPPPPVPPQAVVLVLDSSGSMQGAAIEEVKQAASAYVARQDMARTRIAVVSFGTTSAVVSPLSRDASALQAGISTLEADGLTRMDLALDAGLAQLAGATENRNILLFTDGVPEAEESFVDASALARQSAQRILASKARLLAIATGGAERSFLSELTGDSELVFEATGGQFGEAFAQAEKILAPTSNQIIASAPAQNLSRNQAAARIAVWTALLGLGIVSSLLLAQKSYARQRFAASDALGVLGGVAVGAIAGGVGQLLFDATAGGALLSLFSRVGAWALLGGALGGGTALFVPNLPLPRAIAGGVAGGALGAVGFVAASALAGDGAGRWLGAAILGACIGLAVVLAEVAFRAAWLHVSYGPRDSFDLSLGSQAIAVGSDRAQCRILARGGPAIAARYFLENGRVSIEQEGRRTELQDGDSRTFGNVSVALATTSTCTSASSYGASGPYPAVPERPLHAPRRPINAADGSPASPAVAVAAPTAAPAMIAPPLALAPQVWTLSGASGALRLPGAAVTIGRGSSSAVVVSDSSVSSSHARLQPEPDALSITDLGSTNGTWVNGEKMEPNVARALQDGDQVRLGRVEYVVGRV